MRKLFFLLISIPLVSFAQESYNPFASIGKKANVVTLSNGRYKEMYGGDTIKRIGTVLFDVRTNNIVKFLDEGDTTSYLSKNEGDLSTRWLSIDPLAVKYPFLSPYVFVNNSPIIFVDNDGREIVLNGSSDFKAKTLAALQKLTSDKIELDANNKVVVINGVTNPNNKKPYGTALVSQLVATSNKVTINEVFGSSKNRQPGQNGTIPINEENASNGVGTGSDININIEDPVEFKDISNTKVAPPLQIIVGHELIHAANADKGKVDNTASNSSDPDSNDIKNLTNEEANTRVGENILRKEQSVTPRASSTTKRVFNFKKL